MLALMYWRCQPWRNGPGWIYASDQYAAGRLPIESYLRHVERAFGEGWTLASWLGWFHHRYIWLQHRRVTLEKLVSRSQETAKFELVDDAPPDAGNNGSQVGEPRFFSAPAWLHRAATGNTEIVALRFEPDPTYFDPWLDELVADAYPLELDWDAEPSTDELPQATTAAPLTLLSATLDKGRLAIHLAERLPTDVSLTIHLAGEGPLEITYERWQQRADRTLTLRLASELLPNLGGPILVQQFSI